MLGRLQQQLHDINRSDAGYDIHDFLVTDAHVARAISGGDVLPELRRFYRMSLGDKISHIHAHAWQNSPV